MTIDNAAAQFDTPGILDKALDRMLDDITDTIQDYARYWIQDRVHISRQYCDGNHQDHPCTEHLCEMRWTDGLVFNFDIWPNERTPSSFKLTVEIQDCEGEFEAIRIGLTDSVATYAVNMIG